MMRRTLLVMLALLLAALPLSPVTAQDDGMRVLVYTRTTGFRHLSIPDGIRAIQGLGEEHGFAVDATEDPAAFTDPNLARYDVVIFLNTTSDVVDDPGQAAFERYIRDGGGWVGIHSAADTEYDWPFYGLLLGGAWFLAHPPQQQGLLVNEAPEHPATAHFPDSFPLVDEWYSFQRSPRDRVEVLLSINESTYLQDPNTTCLTGLQSGQLEFPCVSGVMGDHPMSWCVNVGQGTAFYTALGHETYLYYLPMYLQHVWGGIQTAAQVVAADCGPAVADEGVSPVDKPAPDPGDVDPDELDTPDPEATPSTGGGFGLAALLLLLAALSRRRGALPT